VKPALLEKNRLPKKIRAALPQSGRAARSFIKNITAAPKGSGVLFKGQIPLWTYRILERSAAASAAVVVAASASTAVVVTAAVAAVVVAAAAEQENKDDDPAAVVTAHIETTHNVPPIVQ